MRSREAAARALSRLAVLVLVVACTATNADRSPAPTESAPASAPARLTPTPTPTPVGYLVPVPGFMTLRDDFRLAELTDVLVPAAYESDAKRLLPKAKVTAVTSDSALLAKVRGRSTAIALVPPALVDSSLKTLSLDGVYFWDPAADLTAYPLRLDGRADAALPEGRVWDMVAAGEMIFGRGVQWRIEDRYAGDSRPAFDKVRDVTKSATLAVATLEAPLSGAHNKYCDGCVVFVGNEAYISGISDAGIDVVTLAANHIGDGGPQGVLNTVRVLDSAHIAHVGAGADLAAAHRPAIVESGGVRVAFLRYTDVPPVEYVATDSRPGSAWLSHDDPSYADLRAEIRAAKAQADLVVVMPHWGIEYEDRPRDVEVQAAHAMVDAGANVIIGDHPHWVQSVELYQGAYITYGIGNFVFDQMWSTETREGSLQRLSFVGSRLVAVRIMPTLIEDYFQPRLLGPTEPQYRQTLERIWGHSLVTGN